MESSRTDTRSTIAQALERRDRSTAGWADTVATGVKRRPMRRNPTAVSGVWLFLLSSLARRNGLLSLRLRGARREVGTKAKS
jgi:hypothetical protein